MTDIGDQIRFGNYSGASDAAAFTDLDGTATDPTAVLLMVVKPDQTALVYGWPDAATDGTLTRESAGRFYMDVDIDQSGSWRYRLEGTGAVVAASEGSLRVDRQRVTV
jgi:hypothetical protein